MDKLITPTVITAIADPEFEGLVSSALFSQGWNVIARTLDMASLEREVIVANPSQLIVVYSADLPGITSKRIQSLSQSGLTLFGFADAAAGVGDLPEISLRPTSPVEFLAFIRGNIRSPKVRNPLLQQSRNLSSRIIGIGSAGHSTGNTALALNLAQECALLGKNSLLVDANFQSPAVAALLDLRKVSAESKWCDVSENFAVSEITQDKVPGFNDWALEAAAYFDVIFIDLGSLANFASTLTDRRWASQVKIWASVLANSILITSTTDFLQQKRLKDLTAELAKTSLAPELSLAILDVSHSKKKDDSTSNTAGAISRAWLIPYDLRACSLAARERTTLAQVSAKSQLRKSITNIAIEITG